MDFSQEFAKIKSDNKKKSINKIVEDFIKENKIKFNGKKVGIIVGGILVATIILSKPTINNNTFNNLKPNYPIQLIADKGIDLEIPKPTEEINTKISQPLEKHKLKRPSSNTKKQTSNTKTITPIQETIPDTNIYVTIKRTDDSLLKLELEEYIIGVVGAEMPASFSPEALKAQAIIARTYALKSIENNIQLTDDSRTQNYLSNDELKTMWGDTYNTYYPKIKNAVLNTKGIYLTYQGSIIEALYHSTSNGQTEDARYVWGNKVPYLISVQSPYDTTNKTFEESKFISYEELSNKLGFIVTENTEFYIMGHTTSNRVENISINSTIYTGVKLRSLLELKSTDFTIDKKETGIIFTTKGWGHGVGLSQYGAYGMAKNGASYETILKHYYPGVTISKLNT